MIKLIIVTHGPLADAFKESGAMFFGDQVDQVATIGLLPTKSPEVLEKEIKAAVVQSGTKECLIFVDILAGTPFNVVALMIEELKEYHIECFAGVNMPIVMEALASKESMNVAELTEHIGEISAATIVNLRQTLEI
ncbi:MULTISPECIES: PTS sugar transporter subunit IIA [Enterococcus]|uniref:PTS system fructose IIA component n=1 Tax=Enterococcus casseliflavus ATCC 12755 TaxID=888066 RepID=F0ELM4_ENTCA|nr:PTS mannose transporter subunit IIA [Enterococcus casseliflavus]AMG50783.1 PTS mannose transporter subunit IIA [Enterococcus gallinarum]EGC68958.1 PTS system fructose IIA component [Enterococcus casseliflavus ATCC 12755]